MKEIRRLISRYHFKLTVEDVRKINNSLTLELEQEMGIHGSFSTEGGIAIDYTRLGLPDSFGEWLHLRFYRKGYEWDDFKYSMAFVLNIPGGWGKFRYDKRAKEAMIAGMNLLLNHVKDVTGKPDVEVM